MNRLHAPGGNGFAVSRDLNPKLVNTDALRPLGRQTRKHPPAQIRKLQSSIEQFGFVLPVVVDAESRVIHGWGLVLAARKAGLLQVPAVTIDDLDEAKLRLLRLALNRLGEESSWDFDALTLEFSDILEIDVDVDLRIGGFEMGEIDVASARSAGDEEDELPALDETAAPRAQRERQGEAGIDPGSDVASTKGKGAQGRFALFGTANSTCSAVQRRWP